MQIAFFLKNFFWLVLETIKNSIYYSGLKCWLWIRPIHLDNFTVEYVRKLVPKNQKKSSYLSRHLDVTENVTNECSLFDFSHPDITMQDMSKCIDKKMEKMTIITGTETVELQI